MNVTSAASLLKLLQVQGWRRLPALWWLVRGMVGFHGDVGVPVPILVQQWNIHEDSTIIYYIINYLLSVFSVSFGCREHFTLFTLLCKCNRIRTSSVLLRACSLFQPPSTSSVPPVSRQPPWASSAPPPDSERSPLWRVCLWTWSPARGTFREDKVFQRGRGNVRRQKKRRSHQWVEAGKVVRIREFRKGRIKKGKEAGFKVC